MSRSWRSAPPEGRYLRKPQYERTLEEELEEMDTTRYLVMAGWGPVGSDLEMEEVVSLNRTEHGAWVVLQSIAEGRGIELGQRENSFTIDGDKHADFYTWYITTVEEGP